MSEQGGEHRMWLDESHGSDSSLYTAFCSCGKWVSSSLKDPEIPKAQFQRHVEGRPMSGRAKEISRRDDERVGE